MPAHGGADARSADPVATGAAALRGDQSDIRTLSVVIPAFNEELTIGQVVRQVQAADIGSLELELLVVDDGSQDATADVVAAIPGVSLIRHERNGGKGRAVKSGFEAATGDILLIQDADLEYDPDDYKQLLEPLLEGHADAVIGSRFAFGRPTFFIGHRRSPFFSHYLGNTIIIHLTNWLYRHRATDYEGGTKAFMKSAVDSLTIQANGFEYDNELICKLLRLGCRVAERPIRYAPRTYQQGKKINWQDGVRMLWTIVRWRFKRF